MCVFVKRDTKAKPGWLVDWSLKVDNGNRRRDEDSGAGKVCRPALPAFACSPPSRCQSP